LKLLHPSYIIPTVKEPEVVPKKSILSQANPETKIHAGKHRHLAHTRRRSAGGSILTVPARKKCLSKTRRSAYKE